MPIINKNIKFKFKFLTVFLVCTQVLSQPTKGIGEGYIVLCHEEQSTGFNWEKNKWVKVNFIERSFSISRVPFQNYENLSIARSNSIPLCTKPYSKNLGYENITWYDACYTMVELGVKPNILDSKMCVETWNNNKLDVVSCSEHSNRFSFSPSGGFSRSTLADIDLARTKKDSAVISVGKCSPPS